MEKLADLLAQDTVSLTAGDYLASYTMAAGYVPTHKYTTDLHTGKYLFKIEETADGVKIVPVINNEDSTEYVDDSENPVIVLAGNKLHYTTGRNHPYYKDSYNGPTFHTEDVIEGEGHRQVLLAFVEFVNQEFSMGVNDYVVAPAAQLSFTEPAPEPDPEEGV